MERIFTLLAFTFFIQSYLWAQQNSPPCDTNLVYPQTIYTCDSSIVYHGSSYAVNGVYHIVLPSRDSFCDSTIILNVLRDSLCFTPPCDTNLVYPQTIYTCDSSIVYHGSSYAVNGVYHIVLPSRDSFCDSTIILNVLRDSLCFTPPCDTNLVYPQTIYTCDSSIVYHGSSYAVNGVYHVVLPSRDSFCDSTIILNVLRDSVCFTPPCDTNLVYPQTIYTCDSSIVYHGSSYAVNGVYHVVLPSRDSFCDSTIILNVLRDSLCFTLPCDSLSVYAVGGNVGCFSNDTSSFITIYIPNNTTWCNVSIADENITIDRYINTSEVIFNNLPAGIYTYTVTFDSCVYTGYVQITNDHYIEVNINIQKVNNGLYGWRMNVSPANPNTDYTYRLNNQNWTSNGLFNNLSANTYQLSVRDSLGCVLDTLIDVGIDYNTQNTPSVREELDIRAAQLNKIQFPDAFTPNNDGQNDKFRPINYEYYQIKSFTIYNNKGVKIYASDLSDGGWDGQIQGQLQQTGAYNAVLEFIDESDKIHIAKTSFLLIK